MSHKENIIIQNKTLNDNQLMEKSFLYFNEIDIEKKYISNDLPKSFCWKNVDGKDYSTPTKDQGGIGECWAFAALAALESVIEIREDCPELNPDLSEQYLHSCLPIIQEEYNVRPFFWIIDTSDDGNNCNGVITEACFPFEEKYYVPCSNKCSDWQNHLIPISNFSYWIPDKTSSENDEIIKTLLMESGPVTSSIEATILWDKWGHLCHNPNSYFPNIPSIGQLMQKWLGLHVIVIYGWQDNPLMLSGGYWICKNSWGTDFGYDGFFNSAYGALGVGRVIYPIDEIYIPYIGTVDYNPEDYDWPPIAVIDMSFEGVIGENIEFDASGSIDAEDDIVSYHWDLGDGSNATGVSSNHQYISEGEYDVILTVSDSVGNNGHANITVIITN